MGIQIRKVTVGLFFKPLSKLLDSNHHELKVISLNEEETLILSFAMVTENGWKKIPLSFILRNGSSGRITLIFVYPIWWSSMPSLMKGWINRVFTPGIAYSANDQGSFIWNYLRGKQFKKLLKGKTASI